MISKPPSAPSMADAGTSTPEALIGLDEIAPQAESVEGGANLEVLGVSGHQPHRAGPLDGDRLGGPDVPVGLAGGSHPALLRIEADGRRPPPADTVP